MKTKLLWASSKGSSLIITLAVAGVLTGAVLYVNTKVENAKKTLIAITNDSKTRFAMAGVMSYGRYILKSRFCINLSTGIPDPNCKISNANNLERLLLSNSVALAFCNYYQKFPTISADLAPYCAVGATQKLPLREFQFDIKTSQILLAHPLYSLLANTDYGLKGDFIRFKYSSTADEAHSTRINVKITAMVCKSTDCNKTDDKTTNHLVAKAVSEQIFFQNQINQFALVLNRTLNLGPPNVHGAFSDNYLKASSDHKITFGSPVFLNNDINLPEYNNIVSDNVLFNSHTGVAGAASNIS